MDIPAVRIFMIFDLDGCEVTTEQIYLKKEPLKLTTI